VCALAITGHTTEEGPLTDQITLPVRHGGLGLSRTSPALGRAAYLAASAAAHIAMRGGPEAFRPFDGPSGEVLRTQCEALHSEAGDLWKPELKEVHPKRLGHIAEAQGIFAGHEAQAHFIHQIVAGRPALGPCYQGLQQLDKHVQLGCGQWKEGPTVSGSRVRTLRTWERRYVGKHVVGVQQLLDPAHVAAFLLDPLVRRPSQ
jgi:hypothetical protein